MKNVLDKVWVIILIVTSILGLPVFMYQTFATQKDMDTNRSELNQRLDRIETKMDYLIDRKNK